MAEIFRGKAVAAGGFDRAVYNELAELGLTGICVAEDFGGMGMGPVEAMVVLEELGSGLVLEPLTQAFVCSAVIGAYGSADAKAAAQRKDRLEALAKATKCKLK